MDTLRCYLLAVCDIASGIHTLPYAQLCVTKVSKLRNNDCGKTRIANSTSGDPRVCIPVASIVDL